MSEGVSEEGGGAVVVVGEPKNFPEKNFAKKTLPKQTVSWGEGKKGKRDDFV